MATPYTCSSCLQSFSSAQPHICPGRRAVLTVPIICQVPAVVVIPPMSPPLPILVPVQTAAQVSHLPSFRAGRAADHISHARIRPRIPRRRLHQRVCSRPIRPRALHPATPHLPVALPATMGAPQSGQSRILRLLRRAGLLTAPPSRARLVLVYG